MFVNKRGIAAVIARAFLNLVMLGLFGAAVYMMVSLGGKSSASVLSAAAAVVPRVLFAVTPAIFAGMIFVYLYAGKFAGCFIDELLFQKRYLKNVPVILSKVQGAAASVILRSSSIRSAAYQNVAELCVFCSTSSAGIWSSSRTCVIVAKISRK